MTQEELIKELSNLSLEELFEFEEKVDSKISHANYTEQVDGHRKKIDTCPLCGSKHIKRNGHHKDTNHQMYYCHDCHHSFSETHNTLIHSSKKSVDVWDKAIASVLNNDKLTVMAGKCQIHKTTAFYWRHKILERLETLVNKGILSKEIYLDETLLPVTFEEKEERPRS